MSTSKEDILVQIRGVYNSTAFTLTLPEEAVASLSVGSKWRGKVLVTPDKLNGSSRHGAIQAQISEKKKYRDIVRATVDERMVVRIWNRSKYIRAQERLKDRESRNFPVPFNKIREVLPSVRKAIKKVGVLEVIRAIETYFDFCSTGGHIWEGRNHGYKSLYGFLEKLLQVQKDKKKPWWDARETPIRKINDENFRLTKRIANSFAQTFTDEDEFILEEGSKSHHHFETAAAKMVRFIAQKKRKGIDLTQTEMIKNLLMCVQDLFDREGDVVYPAHLSSSATWDAALPQYLKERGVI